MKAMDAVGVDVVDLRVSVDNYRYRIQDSVFSVGQSASISIMNHPRRHPEHSRGNRPVIAVVLESWTVRLLLVGN